MNIALIGCGAYGFPLASSIKKLGKKVKLIGFKKNPYDYLMKADLYINSSYFEGFPNSVVEAAHIGLPIIASQSHGGINEILSGGKGGTIYTDIQNLKKLCLISNQIME